MSATLGQITPSPAADILGTGYSRFVSPFGIDGLCRTDGRRLDLLAVIANQPNTGQFREFMEAAKQEFDEIGIWDILNPELNPVLERYGFMPAAMTDPKTGEWVAGRKWLKPKTTGEP